MVDDPEAARVVLADAFAGGPEVVEPILEAGIRVSYDARSRDDWELNTLFMDHDAYIFHPGDPSEGGPEFAGVYEGVEGYISAMRHFSDSWSNLKVEGGPVKVIDDRSALSLMHWTSEGIRSGLEMKWIALALFEFREGLIVDQRFWWSLDSARRDLGGALPRDW